MPRHPSPIVGVAVAVLSLITWLGSRQTGVVRRRTPRSRPSLGALLALIVLAPQPARGYTLWCDPPCVWELDWVAGERVQWVLNERGCPGLTLEETLAPLEAAFQTWEDVTCSRIAFSSQGTADLDAVGNDGVNLVIWRGEGDPCPWEFGMGALAVTSMFTNPDGTIADTDVEFNALDYVWSNAPDATELDLQSVVLHELGHVLGLGHSGVRGTVMRQDYAPGSLVRALASDDVAGVRALYPEECQACETTEDCPPGSECDLGACTPSSAAPVCTPCSADEECGWPGALCVPYPEGPARCGWACEVDEECASAPGCEGRDCLCVEVPGAEPRQCAPSWYDCSSATECSGLTPCPDGLDCVEGFCEPASCTELGGACAAGRECCSGACLDGLCSSDCDWLRPSESCPSGFFCLNQGCGAGACVPGALGGGERGAGCAGHEECRTGFCASTGGPATCQVACAPDGADACPDEERCVRIAGSTCGVCACHLGALGDPSASSGERASDCASGVSESRDGSTRCTRTCDEPSNPCPEGYECVVSAVVEGSVCWPEREALGAVCAQDAECSGARCAGGRCTRTCELDCDCPAGYRCAEVEGERACESAASEPVTSEVGCGCATAGVPLVGGATVLGLVATLFTAGAR